MRGAFRFFKQVYCEFAEDNVMLYAASVAYFAALSLAPMVLLFVGVTGLLGESAQQKMIDTVTETVGPQAGDIVRSIASSGETFSSAQLSTIISIAVILFSASSVVAALQTGLNRVWDVKAAPDAGWTNWVRKRTLSIAMVLGICFLLLTSMVLTTVISMVLPDTGWMWNVITLMISFAVFVLLFAGMFRFLPDVTIAWRDVWLGAVVTALLFASGKYLLGLYLANASFENRYGAAGSLIAMLVWVYYSTIILFVGAEITQVVAQRSGRPIMPDKHAVPVREVEMPARTA
jgi:membrane protein